MKSDLLLPLQYLEPYKPLPHQVAFHQAPHKYRAMVSGVGAGKTRMGVEEVKKINFLYPGSLGVIGRLTARTLRDTTQRRFFEVIEPSLIANYNKNEGKVWLYTGKSFIDEDGKQRPVLSEIIFAHLDEPGQLGSLDISWFWIDEAHEPDGQEVPEAVFQMLMARLRHPVGPHRGWITSNSGGKDWIWRWFESESANKELFWSERVPTSANARYLPPGYEEELRANNPKVWCDRFLNASVDAFEGQIFPDFDEKRHCIHPSEMEIKTSWPKCGGLDFGVSAPTAVEYVCQDLVNDVIYVYDEDYEANANIPDFARNIKRRGFDILYADPSIVNRGPNKKSPKELYAEEGVYLVGAPNDIDFFITLLTQLLRQDKIKISTKCKNLINQIKQAAWNPNVVAGTSLKETMKIMENHALDAFKYVLNPIGKNNGIIPVVHHSQNKPSKHKFIHPSFYEDEDLHKPDYPHEDIKRRIYEN